MKKDKALLKETLKKRMDYWELNVAGGDYGRGRSDETRELLKEINQLEEPELPVIPQFVADYLSNVDVYSFEERIEILVNSHSGDSYYFHEMLPKDGNISYELGDKLYEYSQNENLKKLFQLINGYTIEKEKLYYLKLKEDLAEQMLLTRHKYLNVSIGKRGQAYTFDDKMGYSSYFKTKLTKEEVEIWKNKLNELEFDIVEVTE